MPVLSSLPGSSINVTRFPNFKSLEGTGWYTSDFMNERDICFEVLVPMRPFSTDHQRWPVSNVAQSSDNL